MGAATATPKGETELQEAEEGDLSEDELFEILSNQRRRHILHSLMQDDSPLEIGDLSQEIAAWEDEVDYEQVSSTDRKRVYTALQQSHLPKMDRAGVIEFDQNRGTIEPTPALEDVEIYMDVVRGRDVPWSHYYLGLTGIAATLVGTVATGIGPMDAIPAAAVSAFVVVAFGVSAVAHWLHARRHRLGIDGEPPATERANA